MAPRLLHEDEIEQVPEWLQRYCPEGPADVHAFCRRQHLLAYAKAAVSLAEQDFASGKIRMEIQSDPDGHGEWLLIEVDVQGMIDDVLASYHRYKEHLTESVPWPQRRLIRTLYNIL